MEYNYKDLIENIYEGVYFIDKERKIVYWNRAAEEITGFSSDEVVGFSCSDSILTHVDDIGNSYCQSLCPLVETIKDGVSKHAELYLHHKDGHRVPVSVRTTALKDMKGEIVGGAEFFVDNSEKSVMSHRLEELETLALVDELTRLSNRRHMDEELIAKLQEMERYGLSFGILFLDIDHFKKCNDLYGHDVGDKVLKTVANTLLNGARPFDIFGRWGGEEFLGIIRNIDSKTLKSVGERCRILIENSYFIYDGKKVNVTVSLGATMAKHGDTIETLVKRADALMYKSKEKGRNRLTMG